MARNHYESIRAEVEENPGDEDAINLAIFAFMPARTHPETSRERTEPEWWTISGAVLIVLVGAIAVTVLGREDELIRDIGTATISGSIVGLVFMFSQNLLSRNQARYQWSADARSALSSPDRLRGLSADSSDLYGVFVEGKHLQSASFAGADLRRAWFIKCYLHWANFSNAQLVNAHIHFCESKKANFEQADLSFSTCHFSNFEDATFTAADLSWASFVATKFHGADFKGATLDSTNLCGADLSGVVNLDKARVSNVSYDEWTIWPEGFAFPVETRRQGNP